MSTIKKLTLSDVSEELLLARYWQLDLSAEQIHEIDALIESDADLCARWEKLGMDLAALKRNKEAAAPADTMRRLQQQLRLRADSEAINPPQRSWQNIFKFAGTFAAGAAAVLLWMNATRAPDPAPIGSEVAIELSTQLRDAPNKFMSDVLPRQNKLSLQTVRLHVMETQALLERTAVSDGEQQELLKEAIAQNKSLQLRAQQQGQADLARVLAALQPVLIELAEADSAQSSSGLVEQFEFESQALLTKLQARSSQSTPDTI
jgi:anti-sigma-K factor RskA